VQKVKKEGGRYAVTAETPSGKQTYYADNVVVCTGGKAAKNFGTDGNGYTLAGGFGHSITALYPTLVQLKTDVKHTKSLKGIRVMDGCLTAMVDGKPVCSLVGDVIFTDYGVSGDAVFRLSAFIADEIEKGQCELYLDFLPQYTEEEVYALLREKKSAFPDMAVGELLFGVVNNQVGRAVLRRAANDLKAAASLVKAFPLTVTGSLGFDYAQVTKGGILLTEVDEGLGSRLKKGLYFAGEILDVDGQCGGFNLQWAYASARMVAQSLEEK
jgi:predicted Rossmann fold flavoprotein